MPVSLRLNLIPSRQWALYQSALCCCALLAMVNLPLPTWQTVAVVISLLVYSYYLALAWRASAVSLQFQQHHILVNDQRVLLRAAVVWPWLVALSFKHAETQKRSRHLIFSDCCTADEYRQLRAKLRFYKPPA